MSVPKKIVDICRKLRRNQTETEVMLWERLRNRKLNGFKFLRQHPIIYEQSNNQFPFFFVADFFCAEKKLVIELDGPIHEIQKEYDGNRDFILKEMKLTILRIKKGGELHQLLQCTLIR